MADYDLVIIGAGVAGLTAATIACRHGLKVVVVDRMGAGGQITTAEKIENFPGFPQGIAGVEFGPLLYEQAEAAGAELTLDTVEALEIDGDTRIVRTGSDDLRAPAVIVAAGSSLRTLGVPGEETFAGKGVSHCASCDGHFFKGQDVCVVGGGDAALDEALVLAGHAARVTIIHRGPALKAQQVLIDRANASGKIEIVLNTMVSEITGETAVTGLKLQKIGKDERTERTASGVFIFVGLDPNSAFLNGVVKLDTGGHIETDILMRTSVPGIFAAGDIRANSVALLAAVAGDGATAAVSAYRYLKAR